MNDTEDQTFEGAPTLYDREILSFVWHTFLATEGKTLQQLADEHGLDIREDGDGDKFITPIFNDIVIQLCEVDGELKLGQYVVVLKKLGDSEDDYEGIYYKLPKDEDLEAFNMN
jgi:hypothetical protein